MGIKFFMVFSSAFIKYLVIHTSFYILTRYCVEDLCYLICGTILKLSLSTIS